MRFSQVKKAVFVKWAPTQMSPRRRRYIRHGFVQKPTMLYNRPLALLKYFHANFSSLQESVPVKPNDIPKKQQLNDGRQYLYQIPPWLQKSKNKQFNSQNSLNQENILEENSHAQVVLNDEKVAGGKSYLNNIPAWLKKSSNEEPRETIGEKREIKNDEKGVVQKEVLGQCKSVYAVKKKSVLNRLAQSIIESDIPEVVKKKVIAESSSKIMEKDQVKAKGHFRISSPPMDILPHALYVNHRNYGANQAKDLYTSFKERQVKRFQARMQKEMELSQKLANRKFSRKTNESSNVVVKQQRVEKVVPVENKFLVEKKEKIKPKKSTLNPKVVQIISNQKHVDKKKFWQDILENVEVDGNKSKLKNELSKLISELTYKPVKLSSREEKQETAQYRLEKLGSRDEKQNAVPIPVPVNFVKPKDRSIQVKNKKRQVNAPRLKSDTIKKGLQQGHTIQMLQPDTFKPQLAKQSQHTCIKREDKQTGTGASPNQFLANAFIEAEKEKNHLKKNEEDQLENEEEKKISDYVDHSDMDSAWATEDKIVIHSLDQAKALLSESLFGKVETLNMYRGNEAKNKPAKETNLTEPLLLSDKSHEGMSPSITEPLFSIGVKKRSRPPAPMLNTLTKAILQQTVPENAHPYNSKTTASEVSGSQGLQVERPIQSKEIAEKIPQDNNEPLHSSAIQEIENILAKHVSTDVPLGRHDAKSLLEMLQKQNNVADYNRFVDMNNLSPTLKIPEEEEESKYEISAMKVQSQGVKGFENTSPEYLNQEINIKDSGIISEMLIPEVNGSVKNDENNQHPHCLEGFPSHITLRDDLDLIQTGSKQLNYSQILGNASENEHKLQMNQSFQTGGMPDAPIPGPRRKPANKRLPIEGPKRAKEVISNVESSPVPNRQSVQVDVDNEIYPRISSSVMEENSPPVTRIGHPQNLLPPRALIKTLNKHLKSRKNDLKKENEPNYLENQTSGYSTRNQVYERKVNSNPAVVKKTKENLSQETTSEGPVDSWNTSRPSSAVKASRHNKVSEMHTGLVGSIVSCLNSTMLKLNIVPKLKSSIKTMIRSFRIDRRIKVEKKKNLTTGRQRFDNRVSLSVNDKELEKRVVLKQKKLTGRDQTGRTKILKKPMAKNIHFSAKRKSNFKGKGLGGYKKKSLQNVCLVKIPKKEDQTVPCEAFPPPTLAYADILNLIFGRGKKKKQHQNR